MIHVIFEGPLSSGAEGLFHCSLPNRGQLAQKYFPGYCRWRQWAIAAITAASSTPNMYLSNWTNTAHTQPLCLRRPSHPSSTLLQAATTIPVQMPIRKSNRNTLRRAMPPLQTHAHSQACAFPLCRRLTSLQSRCGNELTQGRGEGWRVADFCRSSPGSNQQCKELTLSWRRLHKLLSNCFNANHSRDLWHAPYPGFNPPQGTAGLSTARQLSTQTLRHFGGILSLAHKQRYIATRDKANSLAQIKA